MPPTGDEAPEFAFGPLVTAVGATSFGVTSQLDREGMQHYVVVASDQLEELLEEGTVEAEDVRDVSLGRGNSALSRYAVACGADPAAQPFRNLTVIVASDVSLNSGTESCSASSQAIRCLTCPDIQVRLFPLSSPPCNPPSVAFMGADFCVMGHVMPECNGLHLFCGALTGRRSVEVGPNRRTERASSTSFLPSQRTQWGMRSGMALLAQLKAVSMCIYAGFHVGWLTAELYRPTSYSSRFGSLLRLTGGAD
jgi:hypothetical protein